MDTRPKAKEGRCAVVRIPLRGRPFIERDDLEKEEAIKVVDDMNRARGEPTYCLFYAVNDQGGPVGPRVIDKEFDLARYNANKRAASD
jgi:hypothetical protein